MKPFSDRELMTTKEAALFLGIKEDTLLRKVRRGEVPARKSRISGRYWYYRAELAELLELKPVGEGEE